MPQFRSVLDKHFKIRTGHDNTPILARQRGGGGREKLSHVMRELGFKTGVEIGTRWGHSAELWCKNIPGLQLTCIDPYTVYHVRRSQEKQDQIYAEAKQRLEPFGAKILRFRSSEVADKFEDESLDFVNIDGDHTFDAAVMDIVQYVPKVRKGGLILIHDYCAFKLSGVIPAVDAYTRCHDIRPWFVTKEHEPTAFWEKGAEHA